MPATVSHIKTSPIADYTGTVTVGNSSGGTTTMAASQLVLPSDWNSVHSVQITLTGSEIGSLFAAGAGMSLSTNTSGVTFGVAGDYCFEPSITALTATTSHQPGIGTWYFDNFQLPFALSAGILRTPVTCGGALMNSQSFAMTNASNTGARSHVGSFYHNLVLYDIPNSNPAQLVSIDSLQLSTGVTQYMTVNTGTATSNIAISNYATINIPAVWDSLGGVTYSTVTASGAITAVATSLAAVSVDSLLNAANTYLSGSRMDVFGFNTTLAPNAYVIAYQFNSSTASSTSGGYISASGTLMSTNVRPMVLEANYGAYRQVGKSSSNTLSQAAPWHGYITTSQAGPFSPIGTADLRLTNVRLVWNHQNVALA